MTRKINKEKIQNELQSGSVFFQKARPQTQVIPAEMPHNSGQKTAVYRPPVKRRIIRNGFDIYQDQIDALRQIKDTSSGHSSLGGMVRQALDAYIQQITGAAEQTAGDQPSA